MAKVWKELKCPLIDKWVKKMLYIYIYACMYNEILFGHEKEWNHAIYSSRDWTQVYMLSEIAQRESINNILSHLYVDSEKQTNQLMHVQSRLLIA